MIQSFPSLISAAGGAAEAFRLFPLTRRQFLVLWLIGVAWVLARTVLRAARRRREGKPFFVPKLPGTRFYEGRVSGRSRRSLLTRLGGARGSLWVMVAGGELWVSTYFPLNLLCTPENSDLDQRIKGRDILGFAECQGFWTRHCVRVRFRGRKGAEEELELDLRDPHGFRRALAEITAAPPPG